MVPKDQDQFVLYFNNNIDCDQFNQLYDYNWIDKDVQNIDAIICKLG